MGQKFFEDKIGVSSNSGGSVSVAASRITIGGQQYITGTLTRVISADVTLVANTLYFVYAQVISGVVALRISVSPPSVYTVANPVSKLVTAFYSNGVTASVGFGAFVNIVGKPSTQSMPFTPTGTWIANTTYTGTKRREGSYFKYYVNVSLSGAPTATTLTVNIPEVVDDLALLVSQNSVMSRGRAVVSGSDYDVFADKDGAGGVRMRLWESNATYSKSNTVVTSTIPVAWANFDRLWCEFSLPISNLTNTQLVDL